MKRLNIITRPASIDDMAELDTDSLAGSWQLKAERLEAKRLRQFRRQLA